MKEEQIKDELTNLLKALEGGADLTLLRKRSETLAALRHAIGSISPARTVGMRIWRPQEEEQLLIEFDNGKRVEELAANFNRSPSAIAARLLKLGREVIEP